ncbi:beta-sandwich domain-containing protein [Carboxylicivirga caseinilyticus]|uniref:beta-sandwich domain-containing protein n=1 Tax=Carboxylicivirga caseinilyticus TaxID=3417572 RepID=UPI003D33B3B2|nr:carboxypeptidase-like regulatory domain-containing protein [Marinilabiliaceae bacterium A049]
MKTQIILLVGLLFIGVNSFANNKDNKKDADASTSAITSLSGIITDEATGENLAGVKVILEGTDQVAYTDFDGIFTFDNVKKGTYTLKSDYISYADKKTTIDTKKDTKVAIKLEAEK